MPKENSYSIYAFLLTKYLYNHVDFACTHIYFSLVYLLHELAQLVVIA
jgi:hypothetical protein